MVVDYLVKWVEAGTFTEITISKVVSFLLKNIVFKFGHPRVPITHLI
jgi:hypothetical protein